MWKRWTLGAQPPGLHGRRGSCWERNVRVDKQNMKLQWPKRTKRARHRASPAAGCSQAEKTISGARRGGSTERGRGLVGFCRRQREGSEWRRGAAVRKKGPRLLLLPPAETPSCHLTVTCAGGGGGGREPEDKRKHAQAEEEQSSFTAGLESGPGRNRQSSRTLPWDRCRGKSISRRVTGSPSWAARGQLGGGGREMGADRKSVV